MAFLIHRIFATAGISLLYVTMTIQIYLIVDGFIDYRWASSIALTVLFLLPIVVVNSISAFLEFRTQSDDRYPNQRTMSVILHIAQIGLVDRCLQIYRDYDKTKVIYFSTLQLGHVMIGCVPVAIMESYLVKTNDKVDFSTIIFIVCSLMLLASSLVHAEMVAMDVETPSLKFDCNTFRIVTSLIGVTSLVLSRALSIVLFFEAYGYWLFLILSSHFTVVFVIMLVPALKKAEGKNRVLDVCRITGVSCTNVFESFDHTRKRSKCILFLFYAAILVENLAMSAAWMIKTDDSSGFELGMVMTVFSSYLFGIALKYSNCCWRFEDSDELLKALEITKPYDPGELDDDTLTVKKKMNKTTAEFENREVIAIRDENDDVLDSDRKTQASFSNPAFDSEGEHDEIEKLKQKSVRERKKRRRSGNELPKHTTTSDGSNLRSLKIKKNKLKLFSHESTSNTSRNTNTLNVSGGDDPPRCSTCYRFIPGDYPVCHIPNDDNRVYSEETQKHLYHEGNIGHDPNCILRNSLVLDVSNLQLDLQNKRRCNNRFSCTDTSIESDTIDDSLNGYQQTIPLQYSEVTSQDETYTEDTISNFLYGNYSTSTDSELVDPSTRRKALAGHLPTEKLSPDERISAWFKHSNDYFNSHDSHERLHADSPIENNTQFAHPCGNNGEGSKDKNAQFKLKHFDETKSRLFSAKELDRKRDLDLYSHNQVQYNYRNHEHGGRISNVVRTFSEIDRNAGKHTNSTAQKLAHHASLYSKDGHDILRSLSVSSSNPSSNSDRRRRGHRKIPYRDALDEYYRKSTLSYHLPSNGFLRTHIAASGHTPDAATRRWSQHEGRVSPSDNAVIRTRDVESVV